jgi:predicted TIM-barrel fold metal-dependent hydrolase
MKAIDFHAHIYPDKIAEKAVRGIGEFYSIPMGCCGTVQALLEGGARAGIDRFVVQSVATTPKQVESINNFIVEQCALHPNQLIGFGTIHPGMENPLAELERCEKLGLHGIKIHPDVQCFNMDDERMLPIYDYLAGRMPMLIHCGDYRYTYSHPARLAHVLDEFPRLDVVAAHFGGWSLWDLALEYLKNRRCWLDTSSSFAFLGKVRSRELIKLYGVERIVFGVDFPMWDPKEELSTLLDLGFTPEENERLLYKNAFDILGMQP